MKRFSVFFLLVFLLSACNPATPAVTPTLPAPATTPSPAVTALPTAYARVTAVPDVKAAVEGYLAAWQKNDSAAMYALLSSASQQAISAEAFGKVYTDLARNLTLQKLDYEVTTGQTGPSAATASFRVIYHTTLFADIDRQNEVNLTLENSAWKIAWEDGLPLPDLRGGNTLSLEVTPSERGEIQDRDGNTIAGNTNAVAISLIPGDIDTGREGELLDTLSTLTGRVPQSIADLYENAAPQWYIPVGETTQELMDTRGGGLNGAGGIQLWPYGPTRFYYWGGVAPQVTGYVQPIPAEELDDYLRQGFRRDERVGTSGLELWGQQYLATRSATLYVLDKAGQTVSRLGQTDGGQPKTIVTTLDMSLQRQAQAAIRDYRGAIVVLERDTGRVLAMVSSPGYDPNMFTPENNNAQYWLQRLVESPATPLVNRATGGQASGYPLGSVYKIIDMAAALESGLFKAEDTYDCQHYFTEIVGRTYEDWTLKKEYPPSGVLTLPQGLMRSCNPWFYHIGKALFDNGRAQDIANMARGFGLGSPTGIQGVGETAGNVPEPSNEVEAVEQAIGQGKLLVTPLQVASFVAAVGNGGTLYTPGLVEKVVDANGNATLSFAVKERGKLPVKAENLQLIQDAMRWVITNKRGTAYDVFTGMSGFELHGKTGTAQNDVGDPFAWFAVYTNNENSELPDIAIAVVCEQAGEGSEVAAPIARRLLEVYYSGKPIKLFPWETRINVRATEAPPPAPGEEPTPTP